MFGRRRRPLSLAALLAGAVIAVVSLALRTAWPTLSGEAKAARHALHNLVWSAEIADEDRAFLRQAFDQADETAHSAATSRPLSGPRTAFSIRFDERTYRVHALQSLCAAAEEAGRASLAESMHGLLAREMGERTSRR